MHHRLFVFLLACCLGTFVHPLFAKEGGNQATLLEFPEDSLVAYVAERLPLHPVEPMESSYLEGYLQAILDTYYHEFEILVAVNRQEVTLFNMPLNPMISERIVTYIEDFPSVTQVILADDDMLSRGGDGSGSKHSQGVWFPQFSQVFPAFAADPRQLTYAAAGRWNDDPFSKEVAAVSFADFLPIYRWNHLWGRDAELQIDIAGGIWSVFDVTQDTAPLINTDFFVGLPVSYACGSWMMRLRPYHVSSHLGDEFLLNNPTFDRKNRSLEAIDFFVAYQWNPDVFFYGGIGYIVASDDEFELDPLYVEYGVEARFGNKKDWRNGLVRRPFFAVHYRNWEDTDFELDCTYVLGLEYGRIHGIGKKLRLMLEYHDGFSLEGQFSRIESEYLAVKITYGY